MLKTKRPGPVPTWETAISSILNDQLHFVVFFTFLSEIVDEESGFMFSFLSCSLGRDANYFYSFRKSHWPVLGSGDFLRNLHCLHWDWKLQQTSKLKLENKKDQHATCQWDFNSLDGADLVNYKIREKLWDKIWLWGNLLSTKVWVHLKI